MIFRELAVISGMDPEEERLTVIGPAARGCTVMYRSRSAVCSHFESMTPWESLTVASTASRPCTRAGSFTATVRAYIVRGLAVPSLISLTAAGGAWLASTNCLVSSSDTIATASPAAAHRLALIPGIVQTSSRIVAAFGRFAPRFPAAQKLYTYRSIGKQ